MLATQLRALETEGMVKRTIFAEVPPRDEYEITQSALALKPVFDKLFLWAENHGSTLNAEGTQSPGKCGALSATKSL